MISRIIIRGTIVILVQRKNLARKFQGLFKDRGMDALILDEKHPNLNAFLAKGNGLLLTDTYLGFRPMRTIIDAKNEKIAVIFLRRPSDAFEKKDLQAFGKFVLGVFEEEIEDEHIEELVRLAVLFESEVDGAVTLGDD